MNWFANLLVVSGAGVAGYFAEPSLRLELTGIAPAPKTAKLSPALLKIDLATVDPALLPKTIVLKKTAQVTDASSGLKMEITPGSHVKLVRLENGLAVISPGAETIEGTIEPNDTDLREQLAAILPPPAEMASAESGAEPEKPASSVPPGTVDPADPFAPLPTPAAADPAAAAPTAAAADPNDPKTDPFFADANGAAPAPAAATPAEPTAPAAPPEFTAMSPEEIVKTMQESVKSGQLKEFTFDQVTEWTAGEPEKADGKEFNTGVVSYQKKTILGVKAIPAKAFISGGKVVRWIGPRSGVELQ